MSPTTFVRSVVSINSWLSELPSVDAVRPARCPGCLVASRPLGERLRLWGHGVVTRTARGWLAEDLAIPSEGRTTLRLRRYRCTQCKTVMLVGPAEWLPRRHYVRTAVALALFLWALCGKSQGQTYAAIKGLDAERLDLPERWRTLTRWGRAALSGSLFGTRARSPVVALCREALVSVLTELIGAAPAATREAPQRVRLLAGVVQAM